MSNVLLTFAHISDSHLTESAHHDYGPAHYSPRVLAYFQTLKERGVDIASGHEATVSADVANQALVDEVNRVPFQLDFVLHTGDVMTDPDSAAEYELPGKVFGGLNAPVYYLRGNHDNGDGLRGLMPSVSFHNGALDYVIEQNGVRLICLDTATNGVDHGGFLTDEQLGWLETQLMAEPEKPLMVAMHHLPISLGNEMIDFFGMSNGQAVHDVLRKAVPRLRAVFFGHIHQVVDIVQDGVYYCCVQSPMGQPDLWPAVTPTNQREIAATPGFSVVIVTPERSYIRRYVYPAPTGTSGS